MKGKMGMGESESMGHGQIPCMEVGGVAEARKATDEICEQSDQDWDRYAVYGPQEKEDLV